MPLGDSVRSSRDCHPHYAPDPHHNPRFHWSFDCRQRGQTRQQRPRAGRTRHVCRRQTPTTLPRPDLPLLERPPQNPRGTPCGPVRGLSGSLGVARVHQLDRLARGVYPVRQAVTSRMSSVISTATLTTSPTTTIAGGRIPSSATRLSTCSSVELIVRCVGRVPSAITETGVSGLRPYRISSSATAPIRSTAISSTRVPELPPSRAQFTVDRSSPGGTCTDTT